MGLTGNDSKARPTREDLLAFRLSARKLAEHPIPELDSSTSPYVMKVSLRRPRKCGGAAYMLSKGVHHADPSPMGTKENLEVNRLRHQCGYVVGPSYELRTVAVEQEMGVSSSLDYYARRPQNGAVDHNRRGTLGNTHRNSVTKPRLTAFTSSARPLALTRPRGPSERPLYLLLSSYRPRRSKGAWLSRLSNPSDRPILKQNKCQGKQLSQMSSQTLPNQRHLRH